MSDTSADQAALIGGTDMMSTTYQSLLTDIGYLTGFSEIRGSCVIDMRWCVYTAPQLEKLLLASIETGETLDLSRWPQWLHRLALASITDGHMLRFCRQLLLFAYKADITYDQETILTSYRTWCDTNDATKRVCESYSRQTPRLSRQAQRHAQSALFGADWKGIIPSHGPGAVYPRSLKGAWTDWYPTIEYLYPYSDYMYLYFDRDHIAEMDGLRWTEYLTAKLIDVRKDSRGPRLICVHPAEAIWLQQGLGYELVRLLQRRRRSRGPWPRGHVHFDDQTVNGQLALESSLSRHYATLDLKEASDRVSDVLVQDLFGVHYKYFGCCRAQKVTIPALDKAGIDYDSVLHSYAPMGNATTFPVESIVFWAICVSTLCELGLDPNECYVFGDDIIVPSSAVEATMEQLEAFGLQANRRKTFYRGAFRESCGVDAFGGINVTPVRWRKRLWFESEEDLVAACNLGMRLRIAGYETAASCLFRLVRSCAGHQGKRLFVGMTNNPDHGGLAEFTYDYKAVRALARPHKGLDGSTYQIAVTRVDKLATRNSPRLSDRRHVLASLCALERGKAQSTPLDTLSRRVSLTRGWAQVL
jgi:hypothetical protein